MDEWIKQMGKKLFHVHLNDNNGDSDKRLSPGEENIDFKHFYRLLHQFSIDATISTEIEKPIEVTINDCEKAIKEYNTAKIK